MTNNGRYRQKEGLNQSKRQFLRSISTVGLGSITMAGMGAATSQSERSPHIEKASDETRNQFIRVVRNSQQYAAVERLITEGDFRPQFHKATVYEVGQRAEGADTAGLLATIATENLQNDPAEVELYAFSPQRDPDKLELKVKASYGDRPVGILYTDNEIVKEAPGYVENFQASASTMPDMSEVRPYLGIGDIRDAIDGVVDKGTDILEEGADKFTNTLDYLQEEGSDWVDEAYEYKEPLIDTLSPTRSREPPEEIQEEMERQGAEYRTTIDLGRSCYYVGLTLTVGAGITVTMTGVGAGAGTLAVVGAGALTTLAGCEAIDLYNTFIRDTCNVRYLYVYEETDVWGNTENWYIWFPCE